ncbi:MAG: potassium channel protein, partial [Deltaproteobacteria bacterium]|nr:potassium channel protein [Deltaproteobacteria bacterium]
MDIKKRLYLLLVMIFIVVLVGSTGYYILFGGEPTFIDCVYMTVISITSVGYGEVFQIAGNVPAELFTMLLITFGMGVILYSLSTLTAILIEGELSGILRKNKMSKMIHKLENHYIVCGG